MDISIIVALAKNRVIGNDNNLIWHIPKDLKRFKEKTSGHHVIMGRKTYESIGKILPNRTFIIITRNKNYTVSGAYVVHSIEQALEIAKKNQEKEAFIIGGAEIYTQALPLTNKLYLTQIHHTFEGDTYFPEINFNDWELLFKEEHTHHNNISLNFAFCNYQRI